MYKKVISILLVICIFISCFIFNTFALDFPDDLKINGMDYVESFEYLPADSGNVHYHCRLVESITTGYVEFVFISDVPISTISYYYGEYGDENVILYSNLSGIGTLEYNGSTKYCYRAWFNTLEQMPTLEYFTIVLQGLPNFPSYFELYSLWFGTSTSYKNIYIDGAYKLDHGDKFNTLFTFNAAPSQTYVAPDDIFQLYIYPNDKTVKHNCDFVEFDFMCAGVSITSVSLAYGDKILPVSYDNYINGDLSENMHLIRCLADLSIIDRNTSVVDTNDLGFYLVVTGTCNVGDIVYFGSFAIDGYIVNVLPSGEVSWLKKLWTSVVDGFNSVIGALGGNSSEGEEFDNLMQDKLDQMQQANESLNSIDKPNPDTVGDISGIIDSSSSAALSPVLSSLTGSDTFIQIMLLVVTFMLVGFVLFGKK